MDEIIIEETKKDKKQKKQKVKLSKNEKKQKKIEDIKNNPEKHNKVRRLFFGIGKEFWRISWLKKNKILYWFLVTILIIIVFGAIFTAVSYISEAFINL